MTSSWLLQEAISTTSLRLLAAWSTPLAGSPRYRPSVLVVEADEHRIAADQPWSGPGVDVEAARDLFVVRENLRPRRAPPALVPQPHLGRRLGVEHPA